MRKVKTTDKSSTISPKRGNGIVRHEIWADELGKDNGRVLGYDNAHGSHGFVQIKARFNRDLENLLKGAKK